MTVSGFKGISPDDPKQWLILLGIAMVALTIVPFFVFEERLEHTGGPGILAFEFAATKSRASQILAEWGPKGRHVARLSSSSTTPT